MESGITWLPTLYAFDNKKVLRSYRIGHTKRGVVHTETAVVRKASGEHGAIMAKERQIETNARAATTAIAALNYANQEWAKKQRIGRYKPSAKAPKDSEYVSWAAEETRKWPAVCLDWKHAKDVDKECSIDNPWICQPKFDGVRTMAWLSGKEIKLFSRNCRETKFMNHIRDECKQIFDVLKKEYNISDVGLDGEMFVPGISFQGSRSATARSVNKHKDELNTVLMIFDIMEYTMPFTERTKIIEGLKMLLPDLQYISLCCGIPLYSSTDIVNYVKTCAKSGFVEGIVLRRPSILYAEGKNYKHKAMLKLKNFEDAEFEIVGFKAAKGTRVGCVVWKCRDLDDQTIIFECSMTGTEAQQRDMFEHGDDYVGKLLTVKFLNRTEDGKPFHPVGMRFRDEDDLPDESEGEELST